ncbi:MAG: hypothetical protein IIB87_08730, partial [Chloroflexi bacterium]|nr:hypothetical protein [Chloroflexota bacterium]
AARSRASEYDCDPSRAAERSRSRRPRSESNRSTAATWPARSSNGGMRHVFSAMQYRRFPTASEHTTAQPAAVDIVADAATVRFRQPQRAIAAGQAAVFYRGAEVLGGGIISSAST